MIAPLLAHILMLSSFSSVEAAQPSCPYINTETTSGAFQQPATLVVSTHTPKGDVCEFVAANGRLRLSVHVFPSADTAAEYERARSVCAGDAEAVSAIGNEAWRCRVAKAPDAEIIFGRVRDTVFSTQISGIASTVILQDKALLVAEQVANTLY